MFFQWDREVKRLSGKLRKPGWGEYDKMAEYPYVYSALLLYTEEILQVNPDTGRIYDVDVKNKRVLDLIKSLEDSGFESILNTVVFNACKYGEFAVTFDGKNALKLLPPRKYELDPDTEELVFKERKGGKEERISRKKYARLAFLTDIEDQPYGTSILKPARRVWKNLKLLEESLLVYRLTRAPQRYVFYIYVGDRSPEEAMNYINQLRMDIKRRRLIDERTGELRREPGFLSIEDDFFIPVWEEGKETRIDVLSGASNVSDIADVEYFLSQFFGALRIPKAYMGNEYDVNRATLVMQDVRFARTIKRLQKFVQRWLEDLFTKLANHHDIQDPSVKVRMFFPNIDDAMRLEYLMNKADLIDRMSNLRDAEGTPLFNRDELKKMWEGKSAR